MDKTVSTISLKREQTVETVLSRRDGGITRLKPGVNENAVENFSNLKKCSGIYICSFPQNYCRQCDQSEFKVENI